MVAAMVDMMVVRWADKKDMTGAVQWVVPKDVLTADYLDAQWVFCLAA